MPAFKFKFQGAELKSGFTSQRYVCRSDESTVFFEICLTQAVLQP